MKRLNSWRPSWSAAAIFAVALAGVPAGIQAQEERTATFAGGCFWCMEKAYDQVKGVTETISGYANGHVENPSYEEVTGGGTGHVEAVQITYNPEQVGYRHLMEVYWANVDPLDDGGQFCDRGPSYRTGVFYHNERQREIAETSRQRLAQRYELEGEIVTPIEPLESFYPAEDYHQNYHINNSLRYDFYVWNCGRHDRLRELWGEAEAEHLDLFDSD